MHLCQSRVHGACEEIRWTINDSRVAGLHQSSLPPRPNIAAASLH